MENKVSQTSKKRPKNTGKTIVLTRLGGSGLNKVVRIISRKEREDSARKLNRSLMKDLPFISWKRAKPQELKTVFTPSYVDNLIARAQQNAANIAGAAQEW